MNKNLAKEKRTDAKLTDKSSTQSGSLTRIRFRDTRVLTPSLCYVNISVCRNFSNKYPFRTDPLENEKKCFELNKSSQRVAHARRLLLGFQIVFIQRRLILG